MKKACILLLIIVSLLACKKEPELKTYVLEITKVEVEAGTTTANIRATYSYPAELKSAYLKLSYNSDMSASENYLTTLDGNTLNVELNDLSVATKYYYCFEYNNGVSQASTSVISFITSDYSLPIVNTKEVTSITATTAECGGEVTDDGGTTITARGVCWGTSHNPTTNNTHTDDDQGLGEFISSITGLETNVTYYVRAYATNSKGTSYGEECSFTTQEGLAAISTNSVTNITATSAISGGNITDDGGFNITARGVCWSTMQNPTTTNNHTSDGSGLGEFSSSITGLETNMTYYVRAYAINIKGTTYGQERSFTTQDGLATITTSSVTNITISSAICGGNVINDGGFNVTSRGLCWNTSPNPTINDFHTTDGSGTGAFTHSLSGLMECTVYYVRAYAINSIGISYGEQKAFRTLINTPVGAVSGLFSVSSNQQVYFSNGNLQYQANTHIWKFADNQYDYIGSNNQYISSDYSGWIDLFGWGTSGYNNCHPWLIDTYANSYGGYDANITNTNYDWGLYNIISNGGNNSGMWRTLTKSEWVYLLNIRENASSKVSKASVNGVHGLIILPDNYYIPEGFTFLPQANNWTTNHYSSSDWQIMELYGALFLPAAGNRYSTTVSDVNISGYYWSTSLNFDSQYNYKAYGLGFTNDYLDPAHDDYKFTGCSVRLVQDYHP